LWEECPVIEPVDRYVGERIRQRRSMLGLTQDDLAAALGVSYQQIQKYETAANRISAGRLYQIGRRLGVDITYFFEGFQGSDAAALIASEPLPHGGTMRSTIDVAQNFSGITDPEIRAAIAGLVKTLGQRLPMGKIGQR
jgi:transcriptional regulator with XRE-family HTH domain